MAKETSSSNSNSNGRSNGRSQPAGRWSHDGQLQSDRVGQVPIAIPMTPPPTIALGISSNSSRDGTGLASLDDASSLDPQTSVLSRSCPPLAQEADLSTRESLDESRASMSPQILPAQPAQLSINPATAPAPRSATEAVSPELMALLSPSKTAPDDALLRLNLGSFWQWVLCFCIVNFDLEVGQAIELIYPPVQFTDSEKKTIAFSAFPDSNSAEHLGDSCFTFRMRNSRRLSARKAAAPQRPGAGAAEPSLGNDVKVGLPVDTDGYLYGYVFFRQQEDKEVRRGYLQKSLVLLTPYPWPGLFLYTVSLLGPEIMSSLVADRRTNAKASTDAEPAFQGMALLESACFNISSWPPPPSSISPERNYCSTSLQIPFLGKVQKFLFPPNARFPQLFEMARSGSTDLIITAGTDNAPPVLCTPGRFYQLFSRSLESLWMCWELMVIAEPILVTGDTPRACSEAVWMLIELIKPIPFGGDFRPYFTIQDADFKSFTTRLGTPPQGTIVGVTNMVFQKVLEHWPHAIRVARPQMNAIKPPSRSPFSGLGTSNGSVPMANQGSQGLSPGRRGAGMPLESVIESVSTKHKPFLSKDKRLLKEVIEASAQGQTVNALNNMIRRHFMELTERFLQPLNRYFDSLIVGHHLKCGTLSTLRSKPEIKPFRQETFLRQIEQSVPTLPIAAKRPIPDLYRLFLKSPSFAAWLQSRTADVTREWRQRYLDTLCFSPVDTWARGRLAARADVECVDLLLRLREELERFSGFFVLDGGKVRYANVPGIPVNQDTPEQPRAKQPASNSGAGGSSFPPSAGGTSVQQPLSMAALPSASAQPMPVSAAASPGSSPRASGGRRGKRRDTEDFGVDITSLRIATPTNPTTPTQLYSNNRLAGASASSLASADWRQSQQSPLQSFANVQHQQQRTAPVHHRHQSDFTPLNGPASARVGIGMKASSSMSSLSLAPGGRDSPASSPLPLPSMSTPVISGPPSHFSQEQLRTGDPPSQQLQQQQPWSPPSTTTSSTPMTPLAPAPSLGAIGAGGFIPSREHYARMRVQLDTLLAVLPEDLRISLSNTRI
ncbi:hypothetical protein BC831DRAFT_449471 [Entophlyctis helioformis]|nr:hypothetical protein BC831DRAFT_449471 [Entophlyctis helioformis]